MSIVLRIGPSGEAFTDAPREVERLLNRAASLVQSGRISQPGDSAPLIDSNGNTCGSIEWETDD